MTPKLYTSRKWLERKYVIEKMKPEAIAAYCNCEPMTIYRYLHKFNLIK